MGLLLDYIDYKKSLADCCHRHSGSEDGPQMCCGELLQRWTQQLHVSELHRTGIIWADVKPDNVLIDEDHNVWLVEFGGATIRAGWMKM